MICRSAIAVSALLLGISVPNGMAQVASLDATIDRIFEREMHMMKVLPRYEPVVETYIQTLRDDVEFGKVPTGDRYFLGRLMLKSGINEDTYLKRPAKSKKFLDFFSTFFSAEFVSGGFLQMTILDGLNFNRRNYTLSFVGREFLGEIRCVVFDVLPTAKSKSSRFRGRLWAEETGYNIVRFNGNYDGHDSMRQYAGHFDSWRVQMPTGDWLPAYIYSEEPGKHYLLRGRKLQFKAQTRLWGYYQPDTNTQAEFTNITVETPAEENVSDKTTSGTTPASPVQGLRMFERHAEDNALKRLQQAGLLSPPSPVDKVLQTVVNNLIVTNNLDIQPDVRCRLLLTTPLESFVVGRTIILSRGLVDVLPDESSLAMVLAHELGHIVLGHAIDSRYGFHDELLFADPEVLKRFNFQWDASRELAADQKAVELLSKSPYNEKAGSAGLFLRALANRSGDLPNLIQPHFGDRIADQGMILRMTALMDKAPTLQTSRLDQVAALPLGGRVVVEPWTGDVELSKTKGVPLFLPREKMPFEISPFYLDLARRKDIPEKEKEKEKDTQ